MRRPYGVRKSLKQTLTDNQRALDHMADSAGKPRLALYAPEPVKPRQRRERSASAVPSEHQEQAATIQWWHHYSKTVGAEWRQLVAIPNSQMLLWSANNPNAALHYLLAEGMRRGMLDLMLFLARGPYHGLLIELKKSTGGIVSDDQKTMAAVLSKAGYMCRVCKGADEAIGVITEYVEGT